MADYDLLVLGAGATGLGAARTARKAGHRVALVEAAKPGGDCTHYGCVPSKTLIETAKRVHHARTGEAYGFSADPVVDFGAVMKRLNAVIGDIEADESPALLARQGIDLINGYGRFVAPDAVEVDGRRITAEKFVLALGSSAAVPPVEGLDSVPYLDNRSVFALDELPEHLLVMGGGPIGCELAQAFRRLGSAVTIVEMGDRIVGKDEPEASRVLTEVLVREGVDIRVGVGVQRVSGRAGAVTLHLGDDGGTVEGTHLLVATGRAPATKGLGLEIPGVTVAKGGRVETDEYLKTSADNIWAAGDCTAALQFTHVGDEQGRLAAKNAFAAPFRPGLLGGRSAWDDTVIPWVTYTDPEIAHVGLSEAQAYEQYEDAAMVAFVPLSGMDRPRTAGSTDGFVKMVAAERPVLRGAAFMRLVGMTVVAPTGGEMIAEGALSMRAGTLVGRIAQTVHAYPTWSMATRIAAAQFFGTYGGRSARPARPERG